ncbi:MAG: restriction endonuclease subunit S [Chlorobium sp.]|uniref:restriction endonuclease subunit S n=1 Tax=Chlorobium sp. TaxID=1095 RepID=UPI0025C4896A|nr:restriction endonuclease subunit S [Chlorobium sp.]MCF8383955.1 restriction endonuclease subunit S [Chlorobium sp.]
MKDLMPTGQVETYEANVTPSGAMPCGLENPPSVERDSGGGLGLSEWPDFKIPIEWSFVRINDLAVKLKAGGTPSRQNKAYFGGNIPFVLIDDMTSSGVYLKATKETISQKGLDSCSAWIVPENSILLSMYATIGATVINTMPVATNQAIIAIIPHENCDRVYLSFCLRAHNVHLARLNVESTQKNINKGIVSSFPIPLPPLLEQKKIAHILSTVQRAIEAQERLIQTTTELKKALMHKLFTEGLRHEPQKQTEIGLVPESWEVIELGDMLKLAQYGLSVKGNDEGNYPILRMTNQVNGQIVNRNLQYVEISDADHAKFKVERGDILFNRTNSLDLVGRTAIFDIGGDFVFASYLIRLQTDEKHLNPFFLNCYFNTDEIQVRLKSIATRAVSQSNISASRLKGFPIPKPSLDEQEEMVTASLALDRKLAVHQAKLEQLQALFHMLLHELMTAKTRVHDINLLTGGQSA